MRLRAPVPFGISARDRAGQPGPREDLGRPLDDHERPAQRLVLLLERQRLVGLAAVGTGPAQEDPRADIRALEGVGVPPGKLATQRHEPSDVVAMMMAEDHVGDAAQVDLQLACVLEHGFRPRPGVEQDAAAVRLDQCREAPLAHARTGRSASSRGSRPRPTSPAPARLPRVLPPKPSWSAARPQWIQTCRNFGDSDHDGRCRCCRCGVMVGRFLLTGRFV